MNFPVQGIAAVATASDIAPARVLPDALPTWARWLSFDDNGEGWCFAMKPRFEHAQWLPVVGEFAPAPPMQGAVLVCEPDAFTGEGNGRLFALARTVDVMAMGDGSLATLATRTVNPLLRRDYARMSTTPEPRGWRRWFARWLS